MLVGRLRNRLYPILAFWLGVNHSLPRLSADSWFSRYTICNYDGSDTSLIFRYAWTPARQLPGSAPSSSAFYPRFSLLVAT